MQLLNKLQSIVLMIIKEIDIFSTQSIFFFLKDKKKICTTDY